MSHNDARVDTGANRRPEDEQAPSTTVFMPSTMHVVLRGEFMVRPFCAPTILTFSASANSAAAIEGGGAGDEGEEGGDGDGGGGQQLV